MQSYLRTFLTFIGIYLLVRRTPHSEFLRRLFVNRAKVHIFLQSLKFIEIFLDRKSVV